jgi:two-component system chemotaxis response regulator CheY
VCVMDVIIADDSKAMRMLVLRALRHAGFSVTAREAADGKEALELVKESVPDLILSDWNMPVMSGIDFLREVRALGITTPFGFVTSETTARMREEAILAGASFLLGKPFTPEAFQDILTGLV